MWYQSLHEPRRASSALPCPALSPDMGSQELGQVQWWLRLCDHAYSRDTVMGLYIMSTQ